MRDDKDAKPHVTAMEYAMREAMARGLKAPTAAPEPSDEAKAEVTSPPKSLSRTAPESFFVEGAKTLYDDKPLPVAFIYGVFDSSEPDKIVYIGVSKTDPRDRLSIFKSPSGVEKGQPNRRTSVWVQKHLDTVSIKTLSIIHNTTVAQRRAARAEMINKYFENGHPLLNNEVAGPPVARRRKGERRQDREAIEMAQGKYVKDVSSLHPNAHLSRIKTTADLVQATGKPADRTTNVQRTAHLNWHVRRNIYNPMCIACQVENPEWIKQAEHYVGQKTTTRSVQPKTPKSAVLQEDDVRFVGLEARQGRANDHFVSDSGEDNPAVEVVNGSNLTMNAKQWVPGDPNPDVVVTLSSNDDLDNVMSALSATLGANPEALNVLAKALVKNEPPKEVGPTEREKRLESALRDALDSLEFLTAFLKNELDNPE